MIPILQDLLCNQYPTLYQHRDDGQMVFECNDGWFTLIDTLSALIVKRSSTIVAQQVKQGLGLVLVYTSEECDPVDSDYVFGVASMAYWLSLLVCEKCGTNKIIFNSSGLTSHCEIHDKRHQHYMEYDETSDLPFQVKINGLMWRHMILEFYHLIQLHIKCNDMPHVEIKCVGKVNDKLFIELTGGDKVTQGMLALLLAYAARIDDETGDILSP